MLRLSPCSVLLCLISVQQRNTNTFFSQSEPCLGQYYDPKQLTSTRPPQGRSPPSGRARLPSAGGAGRQVARRGLWGGHCSRSSSSVLFPLLLRHRLVVRWRRAGSGRGPAAPRRGLRLPAVPGAMSGGAAGIPKPLPSSGPKSLREMPHPLATSSSEEMGPALTPSPDLLLPRSIADKVRPRGGERRGGGTTTTTSGGGRAAPLPPRNPFPAASRLPGGSEPGEPLPSQAGGCRGRVVPSRGWGRCRSFTVVLLCAPYSVAEPPPASSQQLCGRMLLREYLSLPSLCFPACGVCHEGLCGLCCPALGHGCDGG